MVIVIKPLPQKVAGSFDIQPSSFILSRNSGAGRAGAACLILLRPESLNPLAAALSAAPVASL